MRDDTYHEAAEASTEVGQAYDKANSAYNTVIEDYTDHGGMEMLGRLIAIAAAFAVVGCVWAVML